MIKGKLFTDLPCFFFGRAKKKWPGHRFSCLIWNENRKCNYCTDRGSKNWKENNLEKAQEVRERQT